MRAALSVAAAREATIVASAPTQPSGPQSAIIHRLLSDDDGPSLQPMHESEAPSASLTYKATYPGGAEVQAQTSGPAASPNPAASPSPAAASRILSTSSYQHSSPSKVNRLAAFPPQERASSQASQSVAGFVHGSSGQLAASATVLEDQSLPQTPPAVHRLTGSPQVGAARQLSGVDRERHTPGSQTTGLAYAVQKEAPGAASTIYRHTSARPASALQRSPSTSSPDSSAAPPAPSSLSPASPLPQAPATSEPLGSNAPVNIQQLANRVYELLVRRLNSERLRRGA